MDDRWLDKEQKFYNYRTAEIQGNDIFDLNKASNSDAQQVLERSKYWRDKKNTYSKIVKMSPKEYFEACARDCFDEPIEKLINSRRRDVYILDHLTQVIKKYNKRFPLPYIWYATFRRPEQEGLHRMMVAGDLFGWDTKFPVQIVKWVDEDKAIQEKELKHIREIERYLSRAADQALRYKYYNIEEFKEQLYSEFERETRYLDEFEDRVFRLDLVDSDDQENPGFVAIVDNKYKTFIDLSRIQLLSRSDETTSNDLEDIDLDDENLSDWLKDLLSKNEALDESQRPNFARVEEYLNSTDLKEQLILRFGKNFDTTDKAVEICNFIKEDCSKVECLTSGIDVWKQYAGSFKNIIDSDYAVIRYNDVIYDYTSTCYDLANNEVPRIFKYDINASTRFGLMLYSNGDYYISSLL